MFLGKVFGICPFLFFLLCPTFGQSPKSNEPMKYIFHHRLILFILFYIILVESVFAQTNNSTASLSFSFNIPSDARASAGVFKKDGTLVKTLWSNVKYAAGTYTKTWDGTDDDGRLLTNGNYDIRVLTNNVQYTWEGVIGNTSDQFTGSTVHRSFFPMASVAATGSTVYYTTSYNEGGTSQYKFSVNQPNTCIKITPQRRGGQSTEQVATDGNYVYWAGGKEGTASWIFATKVADDAEVAFPNGISYQSYNAIGITNGFITGLAVQKTGNYLFMSCKELNAVYVLNKTTGALVQTISFSAPRHLAIDGSDNLWISTGDNTLQKYSVNTNGTLNATGLVIIGLTKIGAIAVSVDNNAVLVADAGVSQQLKAFSNNSGSPLWTFGQSGGYSTDPTVTNDKFYFEDASLAFQTDGSFWFLDRKNCRLQHYSSGRAFIERVMYMPHSYSCHVDVNDPTRVFSDGLEFKVDYSKALAPNNGSWSLVKNYNYNIPSGQMMENTMTLSNGRTYAFISNFAGTIRNWKIIELLPNTVRFTGVEIPAIYQWYPDGSIRYLYSFRGQPLSWHKKVLTGFDGANNPLWGTDQVLASTPTITAEDPAYYGTGGTYRAGEQTTSDVMIVFDGAHPKDGASTKYHLGGVKLGDNKWLWRTSKVTFPEYKGEFPKDGSYDVGNGVVYPGSVGIVVDRSVYWGYHGEFWKAGQCNMWNQFYDDGLMVGQFGAAVGGDAPAGMAGNSFSASMVKDRNGNVYLYHNDESYHGGIHRWKITGLNTIQEQSIPITYTAVAGSVLAEYFDNTDLDNINLKLSRIDATVNLSAPIAEITNQNNFSARWSGFVKPDASGMYTFYANTSKGVRLWVDDSLILDKWFNNSLTESGSVSLPLEAGKGYLIQMEINGGTASLSWSGGNQSKQIIPSNYLYPADIHSRATGIDLLEGLPFNKTLVDNMYGWKRSAPEATDLLTYTWWNAKTNQMQWDRRQSPDLYVNYNQNASGSVRTVIRNLGNNSALTSWKLSGAINFEYSFPDAFNGGTYLEVLDPNDRVIARLNHTITFAPGNPLNLYGNNQLIHSESGFESVLWKDQVLEIAASQGAITFKYADYATVTAPLVDPAADWQSPKTMRIYMFGQGYERRIDIASMKFSPTGGTVSNTTPQPPSIQADDVNDVLSASSPLGVSEILVSENGGVWTAYTGQISVGNVDRPQGYWQFKIKAASGRNESPIVPSPAFTVANTTPQPPAVQGDDALDILSASSPLGASEILVSENGGSWIVYNGPISVGNIDRPQGYWQFKIKSAAGRNESVVSLSPAFIVANTIPQPPAVQGDDATDKLDASSPLGASEILVSENGGAWTVYSGTINVGNVARPQGYWQFKIKAAVARSESSVALSPAFTIANTTPAAPIVQGDDVADVLTAASPLGSSEILVSENGGAWISYTGSIHVDNVARSQGYWQFKTRAVSGRNESSVSLSPAFTMSNTTPAAPTVQGDDVADILTASSPLGLSEILVNENNGTWMPYAGQINVGNVNRPNGYWQFKIKATNGRNESAVALSPGFTITNSTPTPPQVTADDVADILSASSPLGVSEIIVSENGGPWMPYIAQIAVGNIARPQGYWQFKIKLHQAEMKVLFLLSPAFTVVNPSQLPPVISLSALNRGSFTAPTNIGLNATAYDPDERLLRLSFSQTVIK